MNEYSIGEIIGMDRTFGVYPTKAAVPTYGINVNDIEEYVEYYYELEIPRVKRVLERQRQKGKLGFPPYFFALLPVIRSKISEKGRVNIVDIGGAQGENYIYLESFFGSEAFEWHVVEQEKNCKYGRKLQLPGNIYFHENIGDGSRCLNEEASALLQQADICLMIGVLQYFDPYSGLLKEVSESGVEYIFITRTMITNIVDTFFTRYYGTANEGKYKDMVLGDTVMAVINHQELNKNMYDLGYDVCFDLFQIGSIPDVQSLPEPYNEIEYRNMLYQSRKSRIL